jgi:flagellar biosynthesis/type III secretory pathway M-ring protein FliF/YscJ
MVLGQAEGFQLLPDAAELIWGVVATVLFVLVVVVVGFLFVRAVSSTPRRRDTRRLRELEERVDRLEGVDHDVEPRVDT